MAPRFASELLSSLIILTFQDTDLASSPVPRPVYTPPPPIPPLKIKVERNPNNDESIYDFNDEEDDNEDALSFGSRLSDLSSKLRCDF